MEKELGVDRGECKQGRIREVKICCVLELKESAYNTESVFSFDRYYNSNVRKMYRVY